MSHHGNDERPVPDFLKEFQKHAQGEFPSGRLNENDEGAIGLAISHENGKVIMQFPSSVTWIGFEPNQAMELAQCLMDHAKEAGITEPFVMKL